MNKENLKILELSLLMVFLYASPILAQSAKDTVPQKEESSSLNPIQEKEISQIISREKVKHNVKSVIYGVWQGNKLIASGALGDSMKGVPAEKEMHFRIGGVTETLLTTLLLQLVDEGKVNLDDKISKWVPELPNSELVTLRMLANSTSGYPDYERSAAFAKAFD